MSVGRVWVALCGILSLRQFEAEVKAQPSLQLQAAAVGGCCVVWLAPVLCSLTVLSLYIPVSQLQGWCLNYAV